MANDTNNFTVGGRLVRDPEMKTLPTGKMVLEFTIANNRWRGREVVQFYRISVWGKRGESLQNVLCKGASVMVSGEHAKEEKESDNGTRTFEQVNANEVNIVGMPKKKTFQQEVEAAEDVIPF